MRGQPQDQDIPACLGKSRYCTTWPTEQPAETKSSIVSKITPKFLKASIKAIENGLAKLSDASADLSYALKDAVRGPWEGWTGLVEVESIRQLEDQKDVVDDLVVRLEDRQREMVRMEDFSDGEQSQEEEPHNNVFNSQDDDGPRRLRRRWMTKLRQGGKNYRVGRPRGA